jgi:phosphatidylglycerol:prolipoprotein diacylglycerol transferase
VGLSLSLIIGYFIGGRFFYLLDNFYYYINHPEDIIYFSVVMYGLVVGIVVALFIYTRIARQPFWINGDIIAPGIMLGFALYRMGCVVNGCCYGLPADLPWAVVYTHPDSLAPLGIAIHPTQMYHLVLSFIAFAILWILRKRLQPDGALFLLWLILFAVTDLPVRFFRVANPFLSGWQLAQIVDVVLLAIAVPWFIIRVRRPPKPLAVKQ